MANNTYSLSWFKKRTAQINRELGTKAYSPSVEYRKYLDAVASGRTTRFVGLYSASGDYRSRTGRANISQAATGDLLARWEGFGNANILGGAILRWVGYSGAYIDTSTGYVWVEVQQDDGTVWVRGYPDYIAPRNSDTVTKKPSGLVPLTNRSATVVLTLLAEKVKARTSRGASGNIGDAVGGYLHEEL